MLFAVERLQAAGGGMIAVAGDEVLALVELPIAGLVSDRPVEEVARGVPRALGRAYEVLGSTLEYPFMSCLDALLGRDPGSSADEPRARRLRRVRARAGRRRRLLTR